MVRARAVGSMAQKLMRALHLESRVKRRSCGMRRITELGRLGQSRERVTVGGMPL